MFFFDLIEIFRGVYYWDFYVICMLKCVERGGGGYWG